MKQSSLNKKKTGVFFSQCRNITAQNKKHIKTIISSTEMSTGPKSSIENPLCQALHKYQLEVVITSSHYICQWTDKRQKAEQNRTETRQMRWVRNYTDLQVSPAATPATSNRSNLAPKYACVLSVFFESVCVYMKCFLNCNTSEEAQLIFLPQTPFLKSYHLFPNSLLTMDCHWAQANNYPDCSIVQALFYLKAFLSLWG